MHWGCWVPGRAASAVLAAALLATGCSDGGEATAGAAAVRNDGGPRILQPGKPGEPARTLGPSEVKTPERSWNHADVAFVQMMIPHHGQALEMSRLAARRATDRRVAALARRIEGAQGPEILTMAAWLQARDLEVPAAADDPGDFNHGAHGHMEMAGMLTPEEMDELRDARGRRFNRLFLQGMVRHHGGAVRMAESTAQDGEDLQVSEMAADVAAGQSAELTRMRELLADL